MSATPATAALQAAGVPFEVHQYRHDRRSTDYGAEAIAQMGTALGVAPEQIFKTLVLDLGERRLGVAVIPVPARLSLKAAAKALGVRRAELAQPAAVTRATGYVLGGVSPVGQRTALPTVLDDSARHYELIWCSAGRRGMEIGLAPDDLVAVTGAAIAAITADG